MLKNDWEVIEQARREKDNPGWLWLAVMVVGMLALYLTAAYIQ